MLTHPLIDQNDEDLPKIPSPSSGNILECARLVLQESPEGLIISHLAEAVTQKYVSQQLEEKGIVVSSSTSAKLVNRMSGAVRTKLSIILPVVTWATRSQSKQEVNIKGGQMKESFLWRTAEEPKEFHVTYQDKHGGPDPSLLPLWFRRDKRVMIMLEEQLESFWKGKTDLEELETVIDSEVCGKSDDEPGSSRDDIPALVIDLCYGKEEDQGLCKYVRDDVLSRKGKDEDMITYILYKFRAAMVSRVVTFLLNHRYAQEREYMWWDLLALFQDRFRQFKVTSGSSTEKQGYWIDDLFLMLRKEGAHLEEVERYVELAFDYMMWFAIGTDNPRFSRETDKAEQLFWKDATSILNRHKQFKTKRINIVADRAFWRKIDARA